MDIHLNLDHYQPLIDDERANCGPTVLAALLGVSASAAIKDMHEYYNKGWNGYSNIGHIRAALEAHGIQMLKADYDEVVFVDHEKPTLAFINLEGPWTEKGWKSQYHHTHWALLHEKMVMDVNNLAMLSGAEDEIKVPWVDYASWDLTIMPGLVKNEEHCTGWGFRGFYEIEEPEGINFMMDGGI